MRVFSGLNLKVFSPFFQLFDFAGKAADGMLQILDIKFYRLWSLCPVEYGKWSFDFHAKERIILINKNLDLFSIISTSYEMFKYIVISA